MSSNINKLSDILLKAEKLAAAVYMVTDFVPSGEPVRIRLRELSINLLADISSTDLKSAIETKGQIISLINIARSVGLISGNNADILLVEFKKSKGQIESEFTMAVDEASLLETNNSTATYHLAQPETTSRGGLPPTNTNVLFERGESTVVGQKASGKILSLGAVMAREPFVKKAAADDDTKNTRRNLIINFIKDNSESSIKDICGIKDKTIRDCSEKTIQRELMSLIDEGLIIKTGEKRWSKYSIK